MGPLASSPSTGSGEPLSEETPPETSLLLSVFQSPSANTEGTSLSEELLPLITTIGSEPGTPMTMQDGDSSSGRRRESFLSDEDASFLRSRVSTEPDMEVQGSPFKSNICFPSATRTRTSPLPALSSGLRIDNLAQNSTASAKKNYSQTHPQKTWRYRFFGYKADGVCVRT